MKDDFEWASSAIALMECDSPSLKSLVSAAGLDPLTGDLAHVDLRHLDLRGQDFKGWDLRYARFDFALISRADFRNAKLNKDSFCLAIGWEEAILGHADQTESDKSGRRLFLEKNLLKLLFEKKLSLDSISRTLDRNNDEDILSHRQLFVLQKTVREIDENKNKLVRFIETLDDPDFDIIYNTVVHKDFLPECDNGYLAELCERHYRQKGLRHHTLYFKNQRFWRSFDLYFPPLEVAVEFIDETPVNAQRNEKGFRIEKINETNVVIADVKKGFFRLNHLGRIERNDAGDREILSRILP